MKTDILIVTHSKDAEWLSWCLKSITKFATGVHKTVVAFPYTDIGALATICDPHSVTRRIFDQIDGQGFNHHQAINCMADQYCDGDFILHMDSDCIFTEPVTPQDYFVDGKPVLLHQSYDGLRQHHPGACQWQDMTSRAVGFPVTQEFMRRHPAVHPRALYTLFRAQIELTQKQPFLKWATSGPNEYPGFWSEFNALGAVAWNSIPSAYHWIDVEKEPWPHNKMAQFWGRGGLERLHDWPGPYMNRKPIDVFREVIGE